MTAPLKIQRPAVLPPEHGQRRFFTFSENPSREARSLKAIVIKKKSKTSFRRTHPRGQVRFLSYADSYKFPSKCFVPSSGFLPLLAYRFVTDMSEWRAWSLATTAPSAVIVSLMPESFSE